MAVPTMNLFTVKDDKEGNPVKVRAKACIVALGNLECQIWSQEDPYTPVLCYRCTGTMYAVTVRLVPDALEEQNQGLR